MGNTIVSRITDVLFDRTPIEELMMDPSKWYYANKHEVNFLREPMQVLYDEKVVEQLSEIAARECTPEETEKWFDD